MIRSIRPTLENLENRDVFSAGPLAGLSLVAPTTAHTPAVVVGADHTGDRHVRVATGDVNNDLQLHLARAAVFGVDFNPEPGSSNASNPPSIAPPKLQQFLPQDLYGDTMSMEEWMNWTARPHDPANGDSIFDFPGGHGRQ
jgi:hypothetical protein